MATSEDIHWLLAAEAASRHIGERPELLRLISLPPVQAVKMDNLRVEEIGGEKGYHLGPPSAVLTQVNDEGAGMGKQSHCRDRRLSADGGVFKAAQIEIANIARETFHARNAIVVEPRLLTVGLSPRNIFCQHIGAVWSTTRGRTGLGAVAHIEMFVVGDGLEC